MSFPVFASGDVLNASDMNGVGLWLVKSQTIGTGVSSVTVSGAFSADYDNYLITINGGSSSATGIIGLRLGATVTNYKNSFIYTSWNGTVAGAGGSADTSFQRFGRNTSSAPSQGMCQLFSPFLATSTRLVGVDISAGDGGSYVGLLDNTTSYTDFTILPLLGGTLTGGTIRVYGYRN
jgi:hypothetical protein